MLTHRKCFDIMKEKLCVENAARLYQLTDILQLFSYQKQMLSYIERCFTSVVETQSYLQLDFNLVEKILDSSGLNFTSELEVFNAADMWLSSNAKERIQYAPDLLLKVRYSSLSDEAFKHVLHKTTKSEYAGECTSLVHNIYESKCNLFGHNTNRYCNQHNFNLLFCGGYDNKLEKPVKNIGQVNAKTLDNYKCLTTKLESRYRCRAVYLKGDVFLLGGDTDDNKKIWPVEKYSCATNQCEVVIEMFDGRQDFSTCGLLDSVYVIGGRTQTVRKGRKRQTLHKSCRQLLKKRLKCGAERYGWNKIADMNEAREFAGCTVFLGRVVVCGGYSCMYERLNSAEMYDHVADTWSHMPRMNEVRACSELVAIKDKLFVIGGLTRTSEVFENNSGCFVLLKKPQRSITNDFERVTGAVAMGNKILVFIREARPVVTYYDVDEEKWSEEPCEVTKYYEGFASLKVPQF